MIINPRQELWLALRLKAFLASLIALAPLAADASTFFVATNGRDSDPGTMEQPFATIQHTQDIVNPGDTVFIRGGTYRITESHIAMNKNIYAYVILINKSGSPGNRINYWAYQNEKPVFDFSAVKPQNLRVNAFSVPASWIHIKGIEVIGVQVTIKEHTQSICFENNGSNNIFEQLSMHDGQAIGIYCVHGSNNLFLNCDAYNNHDFTSEDGKGGNVDGFGCHPSKGSIANVFRGCRAWFNSDDGYDCISSYEGVTFENCWAFYNGYSPDLKKLGDGNGFKVGGYGSMPVDRLPDPIPRHTARFCLSVGNRANGFYANHHIGGGDWLYNTAYRHGNNFNMLCRLKDNITDVPGYGHVLRNNLSYRCSSHIVQIDASKCDASGNSFDTDKKLGDQDFKNLDEKQLLLPRQPNGDLPAITLMKPVDGVFSADTGR